MRNLRVSGAGGLEHKAAVAADHQQEGGVGFGQEHAAAVERAGLHGAMALRLGPQRDVGGGSRDGA